MRGHRAGTRRAAGACAVACALALAACTSSGSDVVETVQTREEAERASTPVRRMSVTVVGAPDVLAREVADVVEPFAESYAEDARPSYVDDAAYEVELFLRERGYSTATARFEIAEDGRKPTIIVDAGARSTIGEVVVRTVGDEPPISNEDLARYVSGPTTGLFGSGPMLFVEERIRATPERVRRDLVALGHLDAEVRLTSGASAPEAGGPVRVEMEVTAGRRYRVVEHTFELDRTAPALGDAAEAEVDDAIVRVFESRDGRLPTFQPRLVSAVRGAVGDALASNGYPDAEVVVEPDIDEETATVEVAVTAIPGPYVTVREVVIQGQDRTRTSFLRSRLALEDGDTYDAKALRKSIQKLYRTGLFSQITTTLEGDGERRSIRVELEERPAVEVFAEPGFGSYELGRLTLGARHRNLFGRGISSVAEATVAVRATRAQVGLSDPWFLQRDLTGDLRVDFDRREEPSFLRESRGIGAFVTKEWTRRRSTTLGYRFGRSSAKDVDVVDEEVLDLQSTVNVAALFATQRFDTRDALFAPSTGGLAEFNFEFGANPLASELEFLRGQLTTSYFAPLSHTDVIAVNLRLGAIVPIFDQTSIPIQERFFAGGENSVRSFRESQLGPEDADGEPLGGEAFGSASIEWRHELVGALQTAMFLDAGFVESQAEDIFSFDDVRPGVGFGLRYLLPIGPLRVDAAFNPDKRPTEDEWVVHFSIGMPF